MQLYAGSSSDFIQSAAQNQIADRLQRAFERHYRYRPSPAEVGSWRNSLRAMSQVMTDAELNDHGVFLEYQLPLTSKRLDCMVMARDRTGRDQAVIVELKQWDRSFETEGVDLVRTFTGGGVRDVLHPSRQVGQYQEYLEGTQTAFHEGETPVALSSCSYLHNYHLVEDDPLRAEKHAAILGKFPLYSADDFDPLCAFLTDRLAAGDGMDVLRRVEAGKYRPSKKLLEHVGNVIKGLPEYVLLDEQLVVYEKIRAIAARGLVGRRKTIVLVQGGPGTGKSVIALNLVGDLAREHRNAHYATGSKAFTTTLRKIVGTRASAQFKYFNSYASAAPDEIDVLICDEAHRIRETSVNRFTRAAARSGKPQIQELLDAARVGVFFVDDRQGVRPDEIGSSELIRGHARNNDCELLEFQLEAQFRCAGSEGFVRWVDNTLEIERTANILWDVNEEAFEVKVFSDPHQLESAIIARAREGHTARMTAGFCWKWSKPNRDGTLVPDVVVGDFKRPWNAVPEATHLAGGIPKASLWAHDPKGIDQIGCVYTAQGFEFDYVGVIWGHDLVYDWQNGRWEGQPTQSQDRTVKRGEDFLNLVKNTYRVLLSRGLKGCYIHFLDQDTERFVRSRIEGTLGVMDRRHEEPRPLVVPAAAPEADSEQLLPFRRLPIEDVRPFENCVPLYQLDIAAGRFGAETHVEAEAQAEELTSPENFTWVELPDPLQPKPGFFVARVVGESMNRRIPNGAWCLFRLAAAGSRVGRIVVARLENRLDPETGAYTIKIYDSEKRANVDGSFRHTRIVLRPMSTEPGHEAIILGPEDEGTVRIVAEFVAVLG